MGEKLLILAVSAGIGFTIIYALFQAGVLAGSPFNIAWGALLAGGLFQLLVRWRTLLH